MNQNARYAKNVIPIARELKFKYHDFCHYNKKNPLDELLFILCSVKRSETVYLRAFKSLKQAFPTYRSLNEASVNEMTKGILWGGMQNQKTRQLNGILTVLVDSFGKPTLAPLSKMSDSDCEKFLCSLPGIGKKVARCVMMYSLGREVFPVDSHCWRVSKRLGWISSVGKNETCTSTDMDKLQELIPPKLRLSLHVNILSFGREVCSGRAPKCHICFIRKYCPTQI
jgi:endonuclease III